MKKILLSTGLFISFATFTGDKQVELKAEAASTENMRGLLQKFTDTYQTELKMNSQLDQVVPQERTATLYKQAVTILDLLSKNPNTKKFIEDFNKLIPEQEKLVKQLPEFLDECAKIPEAQSFINNLQETIAIMQFKGQMMGYQTHTLRSQMTLIPTSLGGSLAISAPEQNKELETLKLAQQELQKQVAELSKKEKPTSCSCVVQ